MLMLFFNPKKERAAMLARAERAVAFKKPWHELRAPRAQVDMGIIASTFAADNPLDEIFTDVPEKGITFENRLRYEKRVLPFGTGLPIRSAPTMWHDHARAFFDEEIKIPTLSFLDNFEWKPWMSLVPMELWTQASGIQASTGHVVLGGLGMGWLLRQIAKKPSVKKITVIENDEGLLNWFGYEVCRRTPKVDEVRCGDFWEHAQSFDTKKVRFIADVWKSFGEAEYDSKLIALRARGAKVWAWGSARPTHYQLSKIAERAKHVPV